jgi:hypothetical protein
MNNTLTTAIPPAVTAPWYARHRPCVYCKAEVVRRRETNDGPVIDVKHHPRCDSLQKG